MTSHEYRLPDVGEGVAEGDLLQWYVSEGEPVGEDQVVAEVETDKAVVDIPSPVDGTVAELLFEEGDLIPVGEIFVVFELAASDPGTADETPETADETDTEPPEAPTGPGESDQQTSETGEMSATSETSTSPEPGRSFAPPSVRRLARELDIAIDDLDGPGASGRITETDVREAAEETSDTRTESTNGADTATAVETPQSEPAEGARETESVSRERTLAQPTTRRIAHELDVDLNEVPSVEKRDGEAFVTKEAVREFAAGSDAEEDATPVQGEERVPYRGVRRTIGEQMERSKFTIPHVTTVDEVDVTDLVEMRDDLAETAEDRGIQLTYLSFVVKAAGNTLQEFPSLNASLDTDAEEIVLKDHYNIGIATEAEDGLRVPVVNDVDRKGLLRIADDVTEVTRKAREGTISREEMQGGTFTISNIGPYGGEHGTPIINHPEVAIIAMGRIKEKPRVIDGEIVPRHVMHLSLSFDHRVVDGATAAQFLNAGKEYLETPELFLLE